MTHRDKALSAVSAIELPTPELKLFQRQWLETKVGRSDIDYSFDFANATPGTDGITWLIGTELNGIPDAMMRFSLYALYKANPKNFHYIDFANNVNGRSVYRFDMIYEKYKNSENQLYKKHSIAGKAFLDSNLESWAKFKGEWERKSNVRMLKKPHPKHQEDDLLMLLLNPRLGVIHDLKMKMTGKNRAVICDMDCNSIFDLGSRKHFGLNSQERSSEDLRSLLLKTDRVLEQRIIHLNSNDKFISLIREVTFNQKVKGMLQEKTIGIKAALSVAASMLPSWEDAADLAADKLKFTIEQRQELLQKAFKQDAYSRKHLGVGLDEKGETHSLTGEAAYIQSVLNYYKESSANEVLSVYQDIFGERQENTSEEEFVRNCSSEDYRRNIETLDFTFPELALENANKKFKSLSM